MKILATIVTIFLVGATFVYLTWDESGPSVLAQKEFSFHVYVPSYIPAGLSLDDQHAFNVMKASDGRTTVSSVYNSRSSIVVLNQYDVGVEFDLAKNFGLGQDTRIVSIEIAKDKTGIFFNNKGNKLSFVTPENVQIIIASSDNIDVNELVKIANSLK